MSARVNSFLAGVRVLDLSRHLPGGLTTLLLADLGAEVLKIEPPAGDEMRQYGPKDSEGRSIYFEAINAGKTSCRVDLKTDAGRHQFLSLVAGADVLVESFRPGVTARLGIDYDSLKTLHPRLIYCSLNGYGRGGTMELASGHDGNFLALSGILYRNAQDKPFFYDPPVADCTGSLMAVIAVLGALAARDRDGGGCEIDLGLADAPMPLQAFHLAALGMNQPVPGPGQGYLNGGAANYQVYATADGRHVMLGALEPKFWDAFCRSAGHPEWSARYHETQPQSGLMADVAAMFASLSLQQAVDRFDAADCCLTPVLDLGEALAHPHYRDRGLIRHATSTGFQALFPAIVNGERPGTREPLVSEPAGAPDLGWKSARSR